MPTLIIAHVLLRPTVAEEVSMYTDLADYPPAVGVGVGQLNVVD
jgi:hypothetical protein